MTIRSFASTIAANGSWIGFAVLFPISAALLAAAFWAEIAQLLFGLADLAVRRVSIRARPSTRPPQRRALREPEQQLPVQPRAIAA